MIFKYLLNGVLRGLDEWAESLTQEQFNTRMSILALLVVMGLVILGGYLEAL